MRQGLIQCRLFGDGILDNCFRNLGEEWNYESTISKSESMISDIESRYVQNKSLRNQGISKFDLLALEQLSQQWEALPTVSESEMKQMGALPEKL